MKTVVFSSRNGPRSYEVAQKPTEGKLFEVNPLKIDRSRFEKPRSDQRQEWTRWKINSAFAEFDRCPEKYADVYYILIPKKWFNGSKTAEEFGAYANFLGADVTNPVEQALEWAQRICNGEEWEDVCNKADELTWYRLIRGDYDEWHIVGGSSISGMELPASNLPSIAYGPTRKFDNCVPSVVFRLGKYRKRTR